jgi:hypothetical protein
VLAVLDLEILIQLNALVCLPGHYTIYLVNMFTENLDITDLLKRVSRKSLRFDVPQYSILLTTAVTVQDGCNLITSIFYCRILDLAGNMHENFLLGVSGFKHYIMRSFVICTPC